jgi:hypothetical protein
MRIVLDTNVLVSAFVSKEGQPAKIVDLLLTFPEIRLILSKQILREFKEVMLREDVRGRFGYSAGDVDLFVKGLRAIASVVTVKSKLKIVRADPEDGIVINTAVDGKADFVVSGDSHLKKLKKFRGIRILNSKQMLEVIVSRFGEIMISSDDFRRTSA